MNIFMTRKKVPVDDAATTKQLKYLNHLCQSRDIVLPFETMHQAKRHLRKYEVSRAIKELLAGNTVEFIYPFNEG